MREKICRKCGVTKPLDAFGAHAQCLVCRADAAAAYRAANPDVELETQRRSRLRNPPRKQTPDQRRDRHFRSRYGITLDQYNEMLADQEGCCASCDELPDAGVRLRVDHCHITGKVRGLLCIGCNVSLGHFHDDPNLIRKLADYAERHSVLELVA